MNRHLCHLIFSLTLVTLLAACTTQASHDTPFIAKHVEQALAPQETGQLQHRIILLGDAGYSTLAPWQPSLKKAAEHASQAPAQTAILLLGDNIYYRGFPRKDNDQTHYSDKQQALIQRLDAQLKMAQISGAALYVLPGNHDWYAEQVDDQAGYIAQFAQKNAVSVHFEPYEKGRPPLPEVVHFKGVSTIFIDSMWLLEGSDADVEHAMNRLDELLHNTLKQFPNQLILLSAHHPIESMGPHNKFYSSNGYRIGVGLAGLFTDIGKQDLPHPSYQRMIQAIRNTVEPYKARMIFAAGHDHSLQVFGGENQSPPQYRIVSGAANTRILSGVGDNRNTLFAVSQEGFIELDVFDRGVRVSAYTIKQPEPVFRHWLWRDEP